MKALPWLRLYTEIIDDEKLGLLSFEDRWHFVAILCLKGKGVIDGEQDPEMLQRKVALKIGLSVAELEKMAKRLYRMGLIDSETFQPVAWSVRQMQSDTSTDRVHAYRERMKQVKREGNVSVTAQEEDTDTDTDTDKELDKKKTKQLPPPEGVSSSVWSDFLQHRKTKKAAVTQTAIDGIAREAVKAGITLNESLAMCCERGWVGFKAEWLIEKQGARSINPAAKASPGKHTGFQNLDYKTGINEDGTFA
jgi:hypothetical protein